MHAHSMVTPTLPVCALPFDSKLVPHLQDLGRCRLRKNVKPAYGFDADGWQTFWQEDLFED